MTKNLLVVPKITDKLNINKSTLSLQARAFIFKNSKGETLYFLIILITFLLICQLSYLSLQSLILYDYNHTIVIIISNA